MTVTRVGRGSPHTEGEHVGPLNSGLGHLAEDLAKRAGFAKCMVRVARTDEMCEVVSLRGRGWSLFGDPDVGGAVPNAMVIALASCAASAGALLFVAAEWRGKPGAGADYVGVPGEPWHPDDLLIALVKDDTGRVRASVILDCPREGVRPTAQQLRELSETLHLPLGVVLNAVENEQFAHQLRVAGDMRELIRGLDQNIGLTALMDLVRDHMREAFAASTLDMYLGPNEDDDAFGFEDVDPLVQATFEPSLCEAWRGHKVVVLDHGRVRNAVAMSAEVEDLLEVFLDEHNLESMALVPIGVGDTYLGLLSISRVNGAGRWTMYEMQAAAEVGRDLGRAVQNVRAHAREQRLRTELERVDEFRSQLIATIAHELKNPIGVIQGHLEMLDGTDLATGYAGRSLEAIGKGAERLATLAEDLVVLSRVTHHEQPMDRERVDLVLLAKECVEFERVTADMAGVGLDFEAGMGRAEIVGQPDALTLVVSNLLSNAIKYSDRDGEVRVRVDRQADRVLLTCTDAGIGMSADDQKHLFEEFYRSSNPAALRRPGSGLGLVILQRVVSRHGGFVEVQSALGEGTTFRVSFPAASDLV